MGLKDNLHHLVENNSGRPPGIGGETGGASLAGEPAGRPATGQVEGPAGQVGFSGIPNRGEIAKKVNRVTDQLAQNMVGGRIFSPGAELYVSKNGGLSVPVLTENGEQLDYYLNAMPKGKLTVRSLAEANIGPFMAGPHGAMFNNDAAAGLQYFEGKIGEIVQKYNMRGRDLGLLAGLRNSVDLMYLYKIQEKENSRLRVEAGARVLPLPARMQAEGGASVPPQQPVPPVRERLPGPSLVGAFTREREGRIAAQKANEGLQAIIDAQSSPQQPAPPRQGPSVTGAYLAERARRMAAEAELLESLNAQAAGVSPQAFNAAMAGKRSAEMERDYRDEVIGRAGEFTKQKVARARDATRENAELKDKLAGARNPVAVAAAGAGGAAAVIALANYLAGQGAPQVSYDDYMTAQSAATAY